MKVEIINRSKHPLPEYGTPLSAGLDLRANIDAPIAFPPLARRTVGTGLYIAIPEGYEGQVRPRSGWAKKEGVTVLNAPGTIDADYRGEIKIILVNLSDKTTTVEDGQRIAQLVIAKCERVDLVPTDKLSETERGSEGFGSTGVS